MNIEIASNAGEQLTLTADDMEVTDDAILDNSLAIHGVRVRPADKPVFDVEIFEYAYGPEGHYLEVYPLDGKNKPIDVRFDGFASDNSIIKTIVSIAVQQRGKRPV